MIHVVQFSGGKDSAALVLWAREHLAGDVRYVFCDTGWEHPITLAYVGYINGLLLDAALVTLKSTRYEGGMVPMLIGRKMIPRARARFCTEELKIFPTVEYVKALNDEVTIYQGIRGDESEERQAAGRRLWSDYYDAWVERPLFDWTVEQVFASLKAHGVEPNPLYLMGAKRVGCFPCVNVSLGELNRFRKSIPAVWDQVAEMEAASGRHFFKNNYIPERFHTGHDADGGIYPTIADVRRYLDQVDEDQIALFDKERPSGCVSEYNLCE